jgi:hypothetical protein
MKVRLGEASLELSGVDIAHLADAASEIAPFLLLVNPPAFEVRQKLHCT